MTDPTTPLEHALAYAARGWRVAPIAPGRKHPRLKAWQDKATTDPDMVRAWWTRFATDGVSIVTGEASQLVVIDIDPRHDGDDTIAELEALHGPLPDTVEAITGGGGRHLYYRMPDGVAYPRNDQAGIVIGAGVDLRGDGGQVVAPPTIHPDTTQPYTWEIEHSPFDGVAVAEAPAWLVEQLTRPAPERKPRATKAATIGDRPGDIFERSCSWPELLEPAGWQLHSVHAHAGGYELWTRPGKDVRHGASASLYYQGSDVLKVFTTSAAPLVGGRTYDRWSFHVAMVYGDVNDVTLAKAAGEYRKSLNAAGINLSTPATGADQDEQTGTDNSRPTRPAIVHNGRQLDAVVAEAIGALHASNKPPTLFVRAGHLARLRQDEERRPMIETLRTDHARLHLAHAATWWRMNKDGESTATPPPLDVAASTLAAGHWPMPALAGVVELPVLRPDGTFAVEHGYDAATKLFHWHRGAPYAPIPDEPTADQVTAAVALIDEAIGDFPWDSTADRANAWGLLLTPLIRPLVGQVPMALIDAPEPGTGKGLLVTVAATLALGRPAGLTAWPTSEEELQKVVTATLMSGSTMVIFDNVEGMIRSANLAAVLTADVWQGRILGRSENAMVPNRATWVATGNNIDVGGDLARRCYRIRLDARIASPWKRTGFRHPDLPIWVAEHRAELIHALCTIVRSWWVAGAPKADALAAMGGYTAWVRTVGGILRHAGITDFLANLDDFHATADREAQQWEAFLATWLDHYGEGGMTVAQLISAMASGSHTGGELHAALPEDLAGYWDTAGFSRRLGHALRKRVGRHYGPDGVHLIEHPRDRQKVAIYGVTTRPVELFQTADAYSAPQHPAVDDAKAQVVDSARGFAGSSPAPHAMGIGEDAKSNSQVGVGAEDPANTHNPRGGDIEWG